MTASYAPGFEVDPLRIKLSRNSGDFLDASLVRREGSAFLLAIDGRDPVWAWVHDPELVGNLFEWFADWGIARYDHQYGLLKVWAGSFFAIVHPLVAAPGQEARAGELLSDVMRRSVGQLG
ncbi:hypothetical protein [Corynebacterium hindlerae]|uniref:hypothetical protein n=1 Tax=Corynebacterium hindlerae TaxID=699041 RepID=UPI003AAFF524